MSCDLLIETGRFATARYSAMKNKRLNIVKPVIMFAAVDDHTKCMKKCIMGSSNKIIKIKPIQKVYGLSLLAKYVQIQ